MTADLPQQLPRAYPEISQEAYSQLHGDGGGCISPCIFHGSGKLLIQCIVSQSNQDAEC